MEFKEQLKKYFEERRNILNMKKLEEVNLPDNVNRFLNGLLDYLDDRRY